MWMMWLFLSSHAPTDYAFASISDPISPFTTNKICLPFHLSHRFRKSRFRIPKFLTLYFCSIARRIKDSNILAISGHHSWRLTIYSNIFASKWNEQKEWSRRRLRFSVGFTSKQKCCLFFWLIYVWSQQHRFT